MRRFTFIWIGQVLSLLGTALTSFGLMIWAWELTGRATALALLGFFAFFPAMLMTPVAGALIDRWNRTTTMIISDLVAGLGTVVIFTLHSLGTLEIWQLYIVAFVSGTFGAFQFPAYSATVTLMVDKKHYARASAMMDIARSASVILGPPVAAAILAFSGLRMILIIDIATFAFAVAILLIVGVPQPPSVEKPSRGVKGILKDALYGFGYIARRRPLLGLQMTYFVSNFFGSFCQYAIAPMILARTGSNEAVLGAVMSAFGVGGVTGGIFLTLWGGPKKKKTNAIFGGIAVSGLVSAFGMALGTDLVVWSSAAFLSAFISPMIGGSSQAIWQSKVEPHRQGRVFSARVFLASMSIGLSMLSLGPMADRWLEPSMAAGGSLAPLLSGLFGTGAGSGLAVIMFFGGLLSTLTACVGYAIGPVRNVETLVPDADTGDGQ